MAEVILHVYDVTISGKGKETMNFMVVQMNKLLKDGIHLGGIFHVAVQIYGEVEWAYGHREKGSGVFSCPATKNPFFTYRESIPAGRTNCSISQVNLILKELQDKWLGKEYSMVSRNSKHFCEELLERLGVPKLPGWANRFAKVGDTAKEVGDKVKQAKRDVVNTLFKSSSAGSDASVSKPRRSRSSSSSSTSGGSILGIGIKCIKNNFRVNSPVVTLDSKPACIEHIPSAPAALCIEAVEYSDDLQKDHSSKGEKKEPIVEEPISDEEEEEDSEPEDLKN